MIDPDQHPFITARHVDDLTEAIRSLSKHIASQAQNHQESIDMLRRQLEMQRETRDITEKLVKALTYATTNGTGEP